MKSPTGEKKLYCLSALPQKCVCVCIVAGIDQLNSLLRYATGHPRQQIASSLLAWDVGGGGFDPRCGRTSAECTSDGGGATSVTHATGRELVCVCVCVTAWSKVVQQGCICVELGWGWGSQGFRKWVRVLPPPPPLPAPISMFINPPWSLVIVRWHSP